VVQVDITRAPLGPGECLALGIDYQTYSRDYDRAVSAAYIAREHKKQADAEQARLALIQVNYERLRTEEQNWNPIQPGVTTTCVSCGTEVYVFGTHRDGFPDDDPQQPHLFRESVDGHAILTVRCECGKSIAVDMGRVAPSAPRNFTSLESVKKASSIKSTEAPEPAGAERKPSLKERLLGAVT
jgi:hypothetical protein